MRIGSTWCEDGRPRAEDALGPAHSRFRLAQDWKARYGLGTGEDLGFMRGSLETLVSEGWMKRLAVRYVPISRRRDPFFAFAVKFRKAVAAEFEGENICR
jgi:hypothetical protein